MNDPLRVLYLANSEQIGGGNRLLLMLCDLICQRGVEPIVTVPRQGPMLDAVAKASLRGLVVPYPPLSWTQPWNLWANHRRWRGVLKEVGPDLVHANGFEAARSVCLSSRRAGLPLVCHVHFPQPPAFLRWVFRGLPKPELFIHNSRATRDEAGPALERYCPASRQVIVYNAVSLDDFHPRAEPPGLHTGVTPAGGTAGLVLPGAGVTVGIVANLLPVKGHKDFLMMARLLTDRGFDARYWIIGEDIHRTGWRTELETFCREQGLVDRVRFWGHRPDVPELMRQMDVLVVASHAEPFGLCTCEAMASGLPVVGTAVGGTVELIEPKVTGLLTPPGQPAALAEAVAQLLSDADLRRRMGAEARRRVERLFSPRKLADDVLVLYRGLRSFRG